MTDLRTRLPNRRLGITGVMEWHGDREWLVTVGFDRAGIAREVFVGSVKPGGFVGIWAQDSCIVLSKLLQHGIDARELLASMAPRHAFLAGEPSFIAALLAFTADMQEAHQVAIAEAYLCADGLHPYQQAAVQP